MGKMKAHAQAAFEVQEFTLCDGWINNWSFNDDDGESRPSYFQTQKDAEIALKWFLDDCEEEVGAGNMADCPDKEDFRIVEVQL
jgi:hypothetical protein